MVGKGYTDAAQEVMIGDDDDELHYDDDDDARAIHEPDSPKSSFSTLGHQGQQYAGFSFAQRQSHAFGSEAMI